MSKQNDTPGFRSITVSGDTAGRMVIDTEFAAVLHLHPEREIVGDPRFLGDPPTTRPDGSCTHCGEVTHFLYGEPVTARWFHQVQSGGGFWADESPVGAS